MSVTVRCPAGPRKLLFKLRQDGMEPRFTDDGTLIELSCVECRKALRRDGDEDVRSVLHLFNVLGQLVRTEVIRGDEGLPS